MTMTAAMADAGLEVMFRVTRMPCARPFMEVSKEDHPDVLDLNDITIKLVNNEYVYVADWCNDMKNLETFAIKSYGAGSQLALSAAELLRKFERERDLIYRNDGRNWLAEVCQKLSQQRDAQAAASAPEPPTAPEGASAPAEAATETSEEFSPDTSWWRDGEEEPEPFESWTPMDACDLLLSDDLAFDFEVTTPGPALPPIPEPPLAPLAPLAPPAPPTPKPTAVKAPKQTGGKAPRQVSDKGQKGPRIPAKEPRIRLRVKDSPVISPASNGHSPFPMSGNIADNVKRARRPRRRNRARDNSSDEYVWDCD